MNERNRETKPAKTPLPPEREGTEEKARDGGQPPPRVSQDQPGGPAGQWATMSEGQKSKAKREVTAQQCCAIVAVTGADPDHFPGEGQKPDEWFHNQSLMTQKAIIAVYQT